MSRRGAIRLNDTHAGGGKMIEARGFPVNGLAQCLLGDRATCTRHDGVFELVSGGDQQATFDGTPLIFEPAELACGCVVNSTCSADYAQI